MYQLNPVYEWVGHAGAAILGGIGGYSAHSGRVDKELHTQLLGLLESPSEKKAIVSKALASEAEEIRENLKDIEWCRKEYARIMANPDSDAMDKEQAEWLKDTSEFEANIQYCRERIQELKRIYASGDNEELARTLSWFYRNLKVISAKRRKIEDAHKIRLNVLTYGGAIAGGVGYHYAKKGLKALYPKVLKKIRKVIK